MPLPGSLAHLKREIAEKKWQEAKSRANLRVTRKNTDTAGRGRRFRNLA